MKKRATIRRREPSSGFSLLEMTISIALFFVVAGAAISALNYSQKASSSEQLKADMHAGLRGAVELMSQEIGQAGSLNFSPRTLGAAVTGSGAAQAVSLTPTSDVFVGELLTVDTGSSQEQVTVTAVASSTVSGIFKLSHASGAPVIATGVFSQGVLSSSSCSAPTSCVLQLFGDVNGDGSLQYVEYNCNSTAGTLTRSITTITTGVTNKNAAQTLLNNVVANPSGTACFQFTTQTVGSYTFVTSVATTLTVQTSQKDPETGQYAQMTKSFLNLASRSVLAGVTLANSGSTTLLQATPPGVPFS